MNHTQYMNQLNPIISYKQLQHQWTIIARVMLIVGKTKYYRVVYIYAHDNMTVQTNNSMLNLIINSKEEMTQHLESNYRWKTTATVARRRASCCQCPSLLSTVKLSLYSAHLQQIYTYMMILQKTFFEEMGFYWGHSEVTSKKLLHLDPSLKQNKWKCIHCIKVVSYCLWVWGDDTISSRESRSETVEHSRRRRNALGRVYLWRWNFNLRSSRSFCFRCRNLFFTLTWKIKSNIVRAVKEKTFFRGKNLG